MISRLFTKKQFLIDLKLWIIFETSRNSWCRLILLCISVLIPKIVSFDFYLSILRYFILIQSVKIGIILGKPRWTHSRISIMLNCIEGLYSKVWLVIISFVNKWSILKIWRLIDFYSLHYRFQNQIFEDDQSYHCFTNQQLLADSFQNF